MLMIIVIWGVSICHIWVTDIRVNMSNCSFKTLFKPQNVVEIVTKKKPIKYPLLKFIPTVKLENYNSMSYVRYYSQ